MKKMLLVMLLVIAAALHAQTASPPKYALVIGNGAYTGMSKLINPVNDANDVAAALTELGFSVEKILNGSIDQMENAVLRLKNKLTTSREAYGFFFYAGHGVQSGGINYLLPVDANIPSETFLRQRAVSVQTVLDELNNAGNHLNVIILDACRDNPFSWNRSGSRGLALVSNQPADSIIVYATSAGSVASDGTSRNGLFTSHLLKNIKTQGLEVSEVFRRTGADVTTASNRQQIPAVYNQFFGTAYLGAPPVARVFEASAASAVTGSLEIFAASRGIIDIIGTNINETVELKDSGRLPIDKINTGKYKIVIHYENGKTEEKTIDVRRNEVSQVEFKYLLPVPKAPPAPKPEKLPVEKIPKEPLAPKEPKVPAEPAAPKEKIARETNPEAARLNSLGASLGSTFAAPLIIATLQGSWSPVNYTFLEFGADFGMQCTIPDVNYFSVYPFAHYSFFLPFAKAVSGEESTDTNASKQGKHGCYLGAGAGLMLGEYRAHGKSAPVSHFTFDVKTGILIANVLDLSYSLRTNFMGGWNHKVSAGIIYQFK